ncbi:MAG: hypothetical protein NZ761_11715, partial [Dehalococcoidia bacterium]|nr:hypothetical protein [Dehalococcoidia bacterium]
MSLLRPFRRPAGEPSRRRRLGGRGTALLVAAALVLAVALPSAAQSVYDWIVVGHRVPALPPESAVVPAAPKPNCRYFTETRHNLCGEFLAYWDRTGGLMQHGYPLTEEYFAPELGVTVQWFERARLEFHPNNPPQFRVLEGHVSREIIILLLQRQGLTPQPTYTP